MGKSGCGSRAVGTDGCATDSPTRPSRPDRAKSGQADSRTDADISCLCKLPAVALQSMTMQIGSASVMMPMLCMAGGSVWVAACCIPGGGKGLSSKSPSSSSRTRRTLAKHSGCFGSGLGQEGVGRGLANGEGLGRTRLAGEPSGESSSRNRSKSDTFSGDAMV